VGGGYAQVMATSEAADRGTVTSIGSRTLAFPRAADRARPIIEAIRPEVDGARRASKAAVGDVLCVEADAFVDGHALVACEIRTRLASEPWETIAMEPIGNDRFRGWLPTHTMGWQSFVIRAMVDEFASWRRDLLARKDAGQDVRLELLVGAELIADAAQRAKGADRKLLLSAADALRDSPRGLETQITGVAEDAGVGSLLLSSEFSQMMTRYSDSARAATSPLHKIFVDRATARFSTWYELFPRSTSSDAKRHGTFADVQKQLEYVAELGFDVLYLPPIHPIGQTGRKGRDGATTAGPLDPGSPWAIGSSAGGHKTIHPDLGTLDEFRDLVARAGEQRIEIAIDLAFQASPDHPWVKEHPEWFRHLPDGTIRFAENPPKRYEDIYPLDFDTSDWEALWTELLDVVLFWISQGISIFRVDNPHTKPFAFWEWLINSVRTGHPEVLFLAEAFTRPPVMQQLAKLGFTQSYTYFTWRSTKWELATYMNELLHTEQVDYFRPNFWPNTPDILSQELQTGGQSAFATRLILAATLSANYGIYGPAFELGEHTARTVGSEEYLHSEKYEIRSWDLDRPDSQGDLVRTVNHLRRAHPALQRNDTLHFHSTDNDHLIAYSKHDESGDVVLVAVNLDHGNTQSGWINLDLDTLGLATQRPFVVHDQLTDAQFQWQGPRNFILLDPSKVPAHIFVVTQAEAL
jgi:starch synthase (maltosyl-transferring)